MITLEFEISQVNPKCPEQTCVSFRQNLACFGSRRFPPAPDPRRQLSRGRLARDRSPPWPSQPAWICVPDCLRARSREVSPQLRARVRRGLLKVEQLHALAREVHDQMKTCSRLTLILASIIYWQAKEISRITAAPDFPFDRNLLRHVSPIEWKNIILYGEITIDPVKLKMRSS